MRPDLRTLIAAMALASLSAIPISIAQPTTAAAPVASLDWLSGHWAGEGTFMGMKSKATIHASPILGGRFVEIRYAVEAARPSGPPVTFEGRGVHRLGAEGWTGHWFDSRGEVLPVKGSVSAEGGAKSFTTAWGDAATERGETRYSLSADGSTLTVEDRVMGKDGSWRVFASHALKRAAKT